MHAIIDWILWLANFLKFWAQESFKEIVKIVSTFWGLILVVVALLWTVLGSIIPLLTLLVDTLNSLVTGEFNLAPPSAVMSIFAIANTFAPVEEFLQRAVAYGTLLGALTLYRVIKAYFVTASSA